ncbi:alkaline phosphatase family protein [Methanotrichaceae archaeon M04Ac]|uniref:Alkaline phosphatase family protein n=1 Tax=Candidatus Methanocrinis alkalitolerans TaxID=3033395 RepID=A0ABT5XBX6_9EURY|nr:alkaline phosphatase family protein [Candidatus Methanocrinis alkalitolerans]MDF0592220.1 alkaline phosphatase family protein [Candidatus Methanocrinis alkalitolerans]
MRLILAALALLLLLAGPASPTTEVLVGEAARPPGAVLLVVDGMGASYVYPELSPRAIDGSPLPRAALFNLTGKGARVQNVAVPVPETGTSHSVLATGCSWMDSAIIGTPGATIFDAAGKDGLLCLALLQRGDAMSMVLEQDGGLFFDDNSLWGAEPLLATKAALPSDLEDLLWTWRDRFPLYNQERGVPGYVGYNAWALDAAADLVTSMGVRPFLLIVNAGAVDSAGHNLGAEGYAETISGLDAPLGRLVEACESEGVLLLITADHGMSFPSNKGKGGHSSSKYSGQPESLSVPAVFMGPEVDDIVISGHWSQVDLAPTLLDLLSIRSALPLSEGRAIPVSKHSDLTVDLGRVGEVEVRTGSDLVARATGDSRYIFRNLERGTYSVESGDKMALVHLSGDQTIDLSKRQPTSPLYLTSSIFEPEKRKYVAAFLIVAVNGVGSLLIYRIIRRR